MTIVRDLGPFISAYILLSNLLKIEKICQHKFCELFCNDVRFREKCDCFYAKSLRFSAEKPQAAGGEKPGPKISALQCFFGALRPNDALTATSSSIAPEIAQFVPW
jgi:hypothetical protein